MIDKFLLLDLEHGGPSKLYGEKFDVIYFSHVIEHISNGLEVLKNFRTLQNKVGPVYVETPSEGSIYFPKKRNSTLNFYDDPTHKADIPGKQHR